MTEISFSNVVIVAAVAFAAPLVLGLIPKLRLPAIVLEIGIAIGPSGLGWVKSDLPVQVLFSWGWRSAVPGRTGCGTIETALGDPTAMIRKVESSFRGRLLGRVRSHSA